MSGRNFLLSLLVSAEVLRIEVTDTCADALPRHSGRGPLLVEAPADRWGVDLGPVPRKTAWAELDLPRP
ncbi:hypothetical protein ABZ318_03175 [Streptomyces sp. NPDC006197]|uniref:hypothetical protein n=1 Tax=Streptomyces sp. NPDC006197 TaxID=3156685 RepID=UPI0033A1D3F1